MPRDLIYGTVGLGTELNPPIIRVIDVTTIPVNGNISGALSASGSPVPPVASCLGFGKGNVSVVISGVVMCDPDSPDPNGMFTLAYTPPTPPAICEWFVVVGTWVYVFQLFSDGTCFLFAQNGSGLGYENGLAGVGVPFVDGAAMPTACSDVCDDTNPCLATSGTGTASFL